MPLEKTTYYFVNKRRVNLLLSCPFILENSHVHRFLGFVKLQEALGFWIQFKAQTTFLLKIDLKIIFLHPE